ncbi:sensor histidine kinase [Nocardioides nitrophenolicus]|uniref:sensor histidine kinase n=1 Tax=Nocardioides nitrophenolicus TaxID=60489 RepID=UPI00195AD609|nr:HAMP domain-containing sensor histidine kinase [Nocardioides nitrophenolicus]MBM7515633.1 signal transduction histidine kinase [Nocardioides nitrophenolicus]
MRRRIVVSTVLLMVAVMVAVGCGVQIVLSLTAERDIGRVLDARADTVIAVARAGETPATALAGRVEPGVRVYDAGGSIVVDTLASSERAGADRLARVTSVRDLAPNERVRLRATPFRTPAGWHGVVVVAEPTEPYERAERYALLATVVVGAVVLLASALLASRITSQALRPVATMADRAAEWSAHDPGKRFGEVTDGPELAHLATTLDGLLDRVARALESEQRLTSELAHELRTPLTGIIGTVELLQLRDPEPPERHADLDRVLALARSMTETIATLLAMARQRAAYGEVTPVAAVLDELREVVGGSVELMADVDPAAAVVVPAPVLVRVLAPVVDNAARFARSVVTLDVRRDAGSVIVEVEDDGPGLDPAARERAFEPGFSGRGGTGLGLPLSRRIAATVGGSVEVVAARGSGARFRVVLPAALDDSHNVSL